MSATEFKTLKIHGWRQFESIQLDLHPRLTIITGANGAGKSTLLSFFTRHFGYNRNFIGTPTSKGGVVSYTYGLFVAFSRGILGRKSQRHEIGTLEYTNGQTATLHLPPTAALHYNVQIERQQQVDGIHIDSHRPPSIYRHVSQFPAAPPQLAEIGNALNGEFINYYSSGSVNQGSLHHIKMTLITMSIFGHGNATMDPVPKLVELFSGFEEKLRLLLPKSLGFQKLIIRSPEVLLSTRAGDFPVDAASGGVIKLFEIAWQLFFYSQGRDRFVVTFDEPENHLHPSMQKSFLPNIVSAFPNAQVIAVTHSPFIITALRDSNVYVLRYTDVEVSSIEEDDDQSIRGLMGAKVSAERLDTINKAGTASEVLRDVLGISTTIPDWAEQRIADIINSYRGQSLDDEKLERLYAQFESEGLVSSYPTALDALTRRK